MSKVNVVLESLRQLDKTVKQAGNSQWLAQCPAHDDHNPSLSIKELDDGTVLLIERR